MMSSIGTMDLANIDLTDFALSMSTALYTTGVGLFANLLIRVQNHSNWACLEKVDQQWEMDNRKFKTSEGIMTAETIKSNQDTMLKDMRASDQPSDDLD
mgnify:CR=1 FL=1